MALHDFGDMPMVLAALAVLLFCAFLALFPAVAGWSTARFASNPGARRLFVLGRRVSYTLCEMFRGWIFTGFPWLDIGTSQVPSSSLAGFAPLGGVYGITLVATFLASRRRFDRRYAAESKVRTRSAMVVGDRRCLRASARASPSQSLRWTEPAGPPVSIALLQGNIAEELKWKDETRKATLEAYRDLVAAAKAKIVVLPETALPELYDKLPDSYTSIACVTWRGKDGKEIVAGVIERERIGDRYGYYNSVVTIGSGPSTGYRKRHLVPFGEFIPPGFAWVFAVLKIPMGDLDRGADGQGALTVDGTSFGVAICYEDLFGRELIDSLPAAQILLNVSNDAWYGHSLAAEQHLQASQMRAPRPAAGWCARRTPAPRPPSIPRARSCRACRPSPGARSWPRPSPARA